MWRFFSDVLNMVVAGRERQKYERLQQNPEEAARSTRFGKKFIVDAVVSLVVVLFALGFAGGNLALFRAMGDLSLAVGFQFVLYIVFFVCACLLVFYSVLFFLTRLKFVKWQRSLNDLPVGKSAKIAAIVCGVLLAALCVATVVLLIYPLASA